MQVSRPCPQRCWVVSLKRDFKVCALIGRPGNSDAYLNLRKIVLIMSDHMATHSLI